LGLQQISFALLKRCLARAQPAGSINASAAAAAAAAKDDEDTAGINATHPTTRSQVAQAHVKPHFRIVTRCLLRREASHKVGGCGDM
jgi:hypothetical protein